MKINNRICNFIEKCFFSRFGFMNLAVTATLIYFFIRFSLRYGIIPFTFSIGSAVEITLSLISINLLVYIFYMSAGRYRILISTLQILLLLILWLTNTYYLTTHVPPDFSLLADNAGLVFSMEAAIVIFSSFQLNHLIAAFIFAVSAVVLEKKYKYISKYPEFKNRRLKLPISIILYLLIVIIPVQSYDQITALAQSAYHRIFPDPRTRKTVTGFPYMKERVDISNTFSYTGKKKPDIYLIMIESFNANFVEAKTPDGKEITPVLNSLIRKGIYFDRFYGNSIQTCKGQAATLLSVTPSIKGKIFTDYLSLKFKALPSYLGESGYDTVFMQAWKDISFDNTGRFMKRAGFADIRTVYEFIEESDKSRIWGWGPEDDLFYEVFFKYLDRRRSENPERPVFAMLATISNHMRFNAMPENKKLLYPHPENITQNYSNSIHLTDSHIKDFIDHISSRKALSDSIIIITGDHSFPVNEHGFIHNEIGYYDESFRIPFLILFNGKLKPDRIADQAFSQIDIAPTILDLAGIQAGANSFKGSSVFLKSKSPRPIYLIQPYSGVYLQSLRYPYKYIYHQKSGDEFIYNLESDPSESVNILSTAPSGIYELLKSDVDEIYFNQRVLDLNLLFR